MENAFRGAIFGKKTSIYNFIEKSTPLQISFNCFVYILEAHPSKQTSKKKTNNFEIYCMLYGYSFSDVIARSFE